jgi:hypothetical protein
VVVITDGEVWGILRDVEAPPEVGEQVVLDLGGPQLIPPIARFAWRDLSIIVIYALTARWEGYREVAA